MIRIGVDFGGTKIEAAALDEGGGFASRIRVPNPGDYDGAIREVRGLIGRVEAEAGPAESIGIGVPGSVSPRTGLMRNANSTYLNGRRFREDLQAALGREIRLANDANCFALSEACDGAVAGARSVFGVILGTGCGGGLVIDGRIVEGAHGVAGEWGHVPLPWPGGDEVPGPKCWCGLEGCLEMWVAGTGLERDYHVRSGKARRSPAIVEAARAGEAEAAAAFDAYVDRLGRGLALIVNVVDPDAFVFGGGMSNVPEIYERLPAIIRRYVFSDYWDGVLVPAKWGDSSGVRGAARLWNDNKPAHPE